MNKHLNAPQFAYYTLYNKKLNNLSGRTNSPKKRYKINNEYIEVDKNLKDKWLDKLNDIDTIEIRSTEEGKSKDRPAHIAFRIKDKIISEITVKKIVECLHDERNNIYSNYSKGRENYYRVIVTGKIWTDMTNEWQNWWEKIIDKIEDCTKNI